MSLKKTLTNQQKQEKKEAMLLLTLQGIAKDVSSLDPFEKNVISRMISNSIFDMRVIWSGYESSELIAQRQAGLKPQRCAEHYFPRQVAGKRILDHVERYGGISKKKLSQYLDIFCRVHYTTSEENTKLRAFQKTDTFISPEHSYQQAGITLIKVK